MAANKYRSVFTGPQIDTILSDVQNKIDRTVIVNDFSGGADFVASAETVKTLNTSLNQLQDPAYLQSLINSSHKNGTTTTLGQTFVAADFDTTLYFGAKVVVGCKSSNGTIQIVEVLFGKSSTDMFIQPGSVIGSSLFTLSTLLVGNKVQLIATATATNLTFSSERVATV